jgi:hypothetical protein
MTIGHSTLELEAFLRALASGVSQKRPLRVTSKPATLRG